VVKSYPRFTRRGENTGCPTTMEGKKTKGMEAAEAKGKNKAGADGVKPLSKLVRTSKVDSRGYVFIPKKRSKKERDPAEH